MAERLARIAEQNRIQKEKASHQHELELKLMKWEERLRLIEEEVFKKNSLRFI